MPPGGFPYKENTMKYFFTTKVKIVLIVAALLTAGLAIVGSLLGKTPADKLR